MTLFSLNLLTHLSSSSSLEPSVGRLLPLLLKVLISQPPGGQSLNPHLSLWSSDPPLAPATASGADPPGGQEGAPVPRPGRRPAGPARGAPDLHDALPAAQHQHLLQGQGLHRVLPAGRRVV